MLADHTADADCNIDPTTLFCTGCDVDHSGKCETCGGSGFHIEDCPEIEEPSPAISASIEALAAHGIGPTWSGTRSDWHRGEDDRQEPVLRAIQDLDDAARFQ